VTIVTVIKRIG